MQSLDYSDRLVFLKLHSLQRRRERYCITCVWKRIEGLVTNFSNTIVCSYTDSTDRSCIVSHVHIGSLGTHAFNSFRWRAIRLFNPMWPMPNHIRCISSCSVLSFKCKLDVKFEEYCQSPWKTWIQQQLGLRQLQ